MSVLNAYIVGALLISPLLAYWVLGPVKEGRSERHVMYTLIVTPVWFFVLLLLILAHILGYDINDR